MVRFWMAPVAALMLSGAAPAMAATWLLGGTAADLASLNVALPGEATLAIEARLFTAAPDSLTNLSQLATTGTVRRETTGIGVAGGASNPQIDTNNAARREALLVSSDRFLQLTGLKLSYIDANDTLQVYGVGAGGALTALGFPGVINTGLGGTAAFTNSAANLGTTSLVFNDPLLASFRQFVFTTRAGGDVLFGGDLGQGYRIDSISAEVVPEPAAWAMLIAGFGLVGAAMRQRNFAVSA